jgi:hypothetical protein
MAEATDRAAKAREARQQKREARAQAAQQESQSITTPRTARTPLEREQARVENARSGADLREAQRIRVEQTGHRPFVGGTTGTHGVSTLEKSGKQYRIVHGAVGEHTMGSTVHASQFPEHTDFQRLLDLGAVVESDDNLDEDEEFGLLDLADAPQETLTEAAYSESPPTLPRVDGIDVEPHVVRAAMKQGIGTDEPREESPEAQRPEAQGDK